ncbi:MAG: hypothetical protein IKA81_07630 [Alistipes sp.]|nr:hypothetical protein [Alistipes sp.]
MSYADSASLCQIISDVGLKVSANNAETLTYAAPEMSTFLHCMPARWSLV